MPLGMSFQAWTNVFRPKVSTWFGENNMLLIEKVAHRSQISLSVLVGAYVLVLLVMFPLLAKYFLGPSYNGLEWLAAGWGGYFMISGIRMVGTSCMLGSQEGYKIIYYYGVYAFIVCIPASLLLTKMIGTIGVLAGLLLAETLLAYLIWYRGWPKIKMASHG
jgi:O-antigen/teichoic acid export membrane protein